MGGEKAQKGLQGQITLGSPPRGRGKGPFPFWFYYSAMDHPRVGGEKLQTVRFCLSFPGSPPRGRGKVFLSSCIQLLSGITPAWAGKSRSPVFPILRGRDHPRVGGEKARTLIVENEPQGSPPRGRGKVVPFFVLRLHNRITPAWAGKRGAKWQDGEQSQDHPRVGGEKLVSSTANVLAMGSPPRGRGKGPEAAVILAHHGITPAWAGKRLKRSHRSGIFISGPIPFHSVLHRPAGSGGSRAGRDGSLAGQPQNAGPA